MPIDRKYSHVIETDLSISMRRRFVFSIDGDEVIVDGVRHDHHRDCNRALERYADRAALCRILDGHAGRDDNHRCCVSSPSVPEEPASLCEIADSIDLRHAAAIVRERNDHRQLPSGHADERTRTGSVLEHRLASQSICSRLCL